MDFFSWKKSFVCFSLRSTYVHTVLDSSLKWHSFFLFKICYQFFGICILLNQNFVIGFSFFFLFLSFSIFLLLFFSSSLIFISIIFKNVTLKIMWKFSHESSILPLHTHLQYLWIGLRKCWENIFFGYSIYPDENI